MTEFYEELKAARAAAGLSQQGLADQTLIPLRTLQKWEIGERTPPPYVQRFVLNELVNRTKTYTQYAALRRRPDGPWEKMHHLFYAKSAYEAEMVIQEDKAHNPLAHKMEYKVMRREVTTKTEEWIDV